MRIPLVDGQFNETLFTQGCSVGSQPVKEAVSKDYSTVVLVGGDMNAGQSENENAIFNEVSEQNSLI